MTQKEYIAILFSDCGYMTATQRKGWLKIRFGKDYPDELTVVQRSQAIELLKEEKDSV